MNTDPPAPGQVLSSSLSEFYLPESHLHIRIPEVSSDLQLNEETTHGDLRNSDVSGEKNIPGNLWESDARYSCHVAKR